ncbi:MAG: PKD domain-containing protein [bacterium]|nr:PKD domain-containing protein [bacterium]
MRKLYFFLTMFLVALLGAGLYLGISGPNSGAESTSEAAAIKIKISDEETGIQLLEQDENGLTVRLDIGSMEFVPVSTQEGDFVLPRVDGFTRSMEVGEPTLPIGAKLLTIPFDCKLKVKVLSSETVDIDLANHGLSNPLMPVQPPLSKSENPENVEFHYKRGAYNGKYVLPLAEAAVVGTMRANHMGRIDICPVEYYPNENRITVYKNVTVEITYKNANWKKTNDMKKRYSSFFFDAVNRQILNYEQSYTEDDLVKYPIKYLIISDRMFEAQLAPFIEWKTKKGFKVVVGYTDTIGSTTTAIKSYIEGLYNAGTTEDPAPSFVLLVGDAQQIPAWSGSSGSHITDLRYCEFTGDDLPEIYYGRFSAQNTTQLQPQIDKTLQYEQYTMPDPSYLGDITLVSGVDSTYAATHGNGQINYGTSYYFNASHGISTNVWLYPASDQSGVDADIIQTINNGVGLYNYTAHCSHTGPADPHFDQSDVAGLTNANKYLLGIGNCCLSNTFGTDYSDPSFGEAWMQKENGGGIGWIGTSNNSYWDEDYWWGVGNGPINSSGTTYAETGIGAYDGVFHDNGEPVNLHYTTNAAIIFAGNTAVTEANSRVQYYWEIYHLMGDPSVMTYLGVPSANSVSHASSVAPTDTAFTVQAEAGSYVGISRSGVLHGAGYIGTSGSTTIDLTAFGTPGTADIVVTCQNKIPYINALTVTAGTEPPTAAFAGTPVSGSVPLTVNFTDQSIGATSWSWNFGDTTTSSEQSPTHQFTQIGTYTVALTATNTNGSDTETKTNYITVTALQAPVAAFTADTTSVQEGNDVTFTDQSTNNPATWAWTFAGGSPATSSDQNPVVTYATAGTYTVTLVATNATGTDTETKTDYITVSDTPLVYCDSQGNNSTYEWIGNVTVGDLNNTSGAADYTDFTSITTDYAAGSTYNVSLTPEFSSSTYTEYWKIWIDLNVDGDFDDSGEELFNATGTAAVSGTLTIPAGTECVTRMRVSMKYDAEQTSSCEAFSYGEVEDYTVSIGPGGVVTPPTAEFHANATTVTEGGSVNFTDDSTNSPTSWAWTFAGGTPSSSSAQNPSVTYNTAGTYAVTLTATNSGGSDGETKNAYITVEPAVVTGLVMENGTLANVASSWQTVNLTNTYTSMVVVCSNDMGTGSPAVTRVRNASGNSFQVMVQNPSGTALSGYTVHYLVVEEGTYTVAADGIKMEAKKADATATANATSWAMESRTYSNSYSSPVVVGQVMTYNDSNWSVFWANGSSRQSPPTASVLNAGKHVGEDTNKMDERKSRIEETIGYIVIEQGSGTINGVPYAAALGSDIVRGPDNSSSGYTYSISVANADTAIVSAAAMDGGNGGWPVLNSALTSTSLNLLFDEDQIKDSERKHGTEQVAYIVFGQ